MSEQSEAHGASRRHCSRRCDESRVVDYLDAAEARGVEVVTAEFIGAREWLIISRGDFGFVPQREDDHRPNHFMDRPTDRKVVDQLDLAEYFGIEVVAVEFVGGRDWRIFTRGAPIPGPAARRVFQPQREE